MLEHPECTRRSVFRIAAAFLLKDAGSRLLAGVRGSGASSKLPSDDLTAAIPTGNSSWNYRQYVVHATVMLGSIPIFSKQNVGGAAIALEEARDNQCAVTGLQLTAGSWPERLRGFNRYGATQEVVREEKQAVTESAYVSFMAVSREKGLSDARKAFVSQAGTQMFTVARGRANRSGCAFGLQHQTLDAKYTWCNSVALLDKLAAQTPLPEEKPVANYGPGCLPTFLFAVHRAILERGESTRAYLHNGKVYRLRMQTKTDESAGLQVMTGASASMGERGESDFRIWLSADDASALPCRIEFRPKSFLKLTLDIDQPSKAETLQPLFESAQAAGRGTKQKRNSADLAASGESVVREFFKS